MSHLRTCPKGHQWETAQDADTPCPVCVSLTEDTPIPPPAAGVPVPPPVPLPPPVVPEYELLGELGRGGMGVVYKARHRPLGRLVALKMIKDGTLAGADQVARFRAEAEAVARLQHPHIVQIYDVGEQYGRPYLALEYVAGGSLDKYLGGKPQPPRQAAALVETLARAVHFAHERGIVHRDLKPGNVLLEGVGSREIGSKDAGSPGPAPLLPTPSPLLPVPKITDFGLAKRLEAPGGLTPTEAVLGTPSYMAPEQAQGKGKTVGPAADTYALGAILYECLTGRPPFVAASSIETVLLVLEQEPVPPRRLQPAVPRDLDAICLKCLEKEPGRRYAGAGALAEDLQRFLAGEPIRIARTGVGRRAAKWARRRPALAGLVAVSAAAVLSLAVAWVLFTASLKSERDRARREQAEAERQRGLAERARGEADARAGAEADAKRAAEEQRDRVTRQQQLTLDYMANVNAELYQQAKERPELQPAYANVLEAGRLLAEELVKLDPANPRALQLQAFNLAQAADTAQRLNKRPEARRHCADALALADRLARPGPEADTRRAAVLTCGMVAGTLKALDDLEPARAACIRALEVARALDSQKEPRLPFYVVNVCTLLGETLDRLGRRQEALAAHEEAVHRAALWLEEKNEPERRRLLADALVGLGDVRLALGDKEAAGETYLEVNRLRLALWKEEDTIPHRQALAVSFERLGDAHRALGDLEQARAAYDNHVRVRKALVPERKAPPSSAFAYNADDARCNLAMAYAKVGHLERERGDKARAAQAYRQGLDVLEELVRHNPEPRYRKQLARTYAGLGHARTLLTDYRAAEEAFLAAATAAQEVVAQDADDLDARRLLASCHGKLGSARLRLGKAGPAREAYRQQVAVCRDVLEAKDGAEHREELAGALGNLAYAELFNRRPDEAVAASREALELAPGETWLWTNLAHGHLFAGRYEEAVQIYLQYRDEAVPGDKTFARAVLDDFRELRQAGVTHPDVEKVERLLAKAPA